MRISDWSSDVGAADRGERLTGHSPGADSGGAGLVLEDRPGEYVVRAEGTPALVAALTAWLAERDLPLADLRAGRQRLEDVFLRLIADQPASPQSDLDDDRGTQRRRRRRSEEHTSELQSLMRSSYAVFCL